MKKRAGSFCVCYYVLSDYLENRELNTNQEVGTSLCTNSEHGIISCI